MRLLLTVLIAVIVFVSCKKESKTDLESLNEITVTLNNCNSDGPDTSHLICFTKLEDSRCPINANCIWEGIAIAKFSIKLENTLHQVTLATTKLSNMPSTDTTVAGYKIQLLSIMPYPGSIGLPTTATLRITK